MDFPLANPIMQKSRGSDNMQNSWDAQTNTLIVKNYSLNDKLISGNVMWYHDSRISVHQYGEREEDQNQNLFFCQKDTTFPWVREGWLFGGDKKSFPLQLWVIFCNMFSLKMLKLFLLVFFGGGGIGFVLR